MLATKGTRSGAVFGPRSVLAGLAVVLGVGFVVGTFIITDGDPLEILTTIEGAWLEGVEIDPSQDRQRRLYEQYDNRPPPAPQRDSHD